MKLVTGDLWTYQADARCITTNGFVKMNGEAVMGRGCALEAKQRYPQIAQRLGSLLRSHGNQVHHLGVEEGATLFSFPVKHHWTDRADKQLIVRSAVQLLNALLYFPEIQVVALPRPGCGHGGLSWEKDVEPILRPMLDDRFHIITKESRS